MIFFEVDFLQNFSVQFHRRTGELFEEIKNI